MDVAKIGSIIDDTGKALDIAANIAKGIEIAVGSRQGAADTATNPTKQGLLVGMLQMLGQWIGPGTDDQLKTIVNGGVARMNENKPVVTVVPDSQIVAVTGSVPVTVTIQIGATK